MEIKFLEDMDIGKYGMLECPECKMRSMFNPDSIFSYHFKGCSKIKPDYHDGNQGCSYIIGPKSVDYVREYVKSMTFRGSIDETKIIPHMIVTLGQLKAALPDLKL
jgi:hypothetical protein